MEVVEVVELAGAGAGVAAGAGMPSREISSETVTKVNPLARSPSSAAGMASMVEGWMS